MNISMSKGVISRGVSAPMIKEGDDLVNIVVKSVIDEGTSEEKINKLIKEKKDLVGSMTSQGTTPRLYRDLLVSLMDLTSGSGDRATPIVLIQNYFRD